MTGTCRMRFRKALRQLQQVHIAGLSMDDHSSTLQAPKLQSHLLLFESAASSATEGSEVAACLETKRDTDTCFRTELTGCLQACLEGKPAKWGFTALEGSSCCC